jgi:hypothetical protein
MSMPFFEDFIGREATLYIQVAFGENKEIVDKELKIVFED